MAGCALLRPFSVDEVMAEISFRESLAPEIERWE
jgi:hypothetical protein